MNIRKHILFDLDGTLIDPAEGICGSVAHALETLGRPVPEQAVLEKFIGPPLDEGFSEFCGLGPDEIDKAVLAFRDRFAEWGIRANTLFPGMDGLLARLRQQGYQLYIATSKPTDFANIILESHGVAGYFTLVRGSGLSHVGHKKADVIAEVLADGGISPGEAVMVGDRRHDVAGAKACGLPCVGVLFGYGGRQELEAAGAERLAADIPELEAILTGPGF